MEQLFSNNNPGQIPTRILSSMETKDAHDKNRERDEYSKIETFLKNKKEKEIYRMSPYSLHAQISGHYYGVVRDAIKYFFQENKKFVQYGTSSSHMRSHNLYRGDDGIIYVIHSWCGEICDAFYFSRNELETYFEDEHMETMPDFNDPPQVSELY